MPAALITDLTQYRMARRAPVAEACHWPEAIESIIASNFRFAFAMQRMWLRAIWRV